MGQTIYQVDAFTSRPFTGNPAAICVLEAARAESWMQDVAAEMNLAETAFLVPQADGYQLRWFTPVAEVDLCGHATLASAHILWETGQLPLETEARFHSKSGLLTAVRQGEWIELNFPAVPDTPVETPEGLEEALGVTVEYVGRNRLDVLVTVTSERIVREIQPNMTLLSTLPTRGVIVTARSESSEFDFVSRFFAPRLGIPEDPATGSAHCCLGPYWQRQLGQSTLTGYQASPRGGVVKVRMEADRVFLGGQAITTLRGELLC